MSEQPRQPEAAETRPRAGGTARPRAIGLTASATLVLATLISVAGVRHTARDAIDQEVRENLARLAGAIAATIDPELHATLTEPDQESGPVYAALTEPLSAVIRKTPGVRFVYTLRPVGDDLVFVVDGTPVGDADADGVEDHSFLMDVYEDPDPAAWQSVLERKVTVTDEPYTDLWGTFLSGFAPLRRADGRVDGVIGVDVSAAEYHRRLAEVDRAAMWALLPGLLISVGVGLLAWRTARRMDDRTREVEAHRRNAERANRAKSALLANISHELRTPLTAIKGFIEVAADARATPDERAEGIATVRDNAEHLLALINDLLDISKVEAGAISIEAVEVDVRELVRTAVAPVRLRAQDKKIGLEVVGAENLPERAALDPTRTRQILLNLLTNAVKFTDHGKVTLSLDAGGGMLEFRVVDTGPGMDAEQLSRLFQPFSQVGGSADKRREGTGLGLAISQHLAGLMGGRVSVESAPGHGSVFTARIPYGHVEPDAANTGLAGSFAAAGPLSGRRILVAEDGADNRKLLRFILSRAGAEVEEQHDGVDALEAMLRAIAAGDAPDLVLTDWDMPRLDGAGLVRALREAGWRGPVISLTAHAMEDQHQACMDAGCDEHLTKPIDWAVLVETCVGLIEGRGKRAA